MDSSGATHPYDICSSVFGTFHMSPRNGHLCIFLDTKTSPLTSRNLPMFFYGQHESLVELRHQWLRYPSYLLALGLSPILRLVILQTLFLENQNCFLLCLTVLQCFGNLDCPELLRSHALIVCFNCGPMHMPTDCRETSFPCKPP